MRLILSIIFITFVSSACVLPGGIAPNTENPLPPITEDGQISPLNTEVPAPGPVKLYTDVREMDLSVYGVSLGEPIILTLWFEQDHQMVRKRWQHSPTHLGDREESGSGGPQSALTRSYRKRC